MDVQILVAFREGLFETSWHEQRGHKFHFGGSGVHASSFHEKPPKYERSPHVILSTNHSTPNNVFQKPISHANHLLTEDKHCCTYCGSLNG